MKNVLKFLGFFFALVMAHQATAQKAHDPVWKKDFKQNFLDWVDQKDVVAAGQLVDKWLAMSATEKGKYLRDTSKVIVSDVIHVVKADLVHFAYGQMQSMTVKDAVLPIVFLRVGNALNISGYGEFLFPMYTYKGTSDPLEYNPDLVASFYFDGDTSPDLAVYNTVTKKVEAYPAGPSTPQNAPIASNVPNNGGTTGNGQVGFVDTGKGYSVLRDANGKAILDANGDQIIQMVGNGQVAQTPAPKVDSTMRTASYSVNVAQSGDPNLLASNGGFIQQGQQTVGGKLPSTVYDVDPAKTLYQLNQSTGMIEPVEKSLPPFSVVDPGTNGVILNSKGGMTRDNNRIMRMRIRNGYDEFGNPTEATIEKMKARNRFWNGGGWITMQQPGFYYGNNGGCNNCNMPVPVYNAPTMGGTSGSLWGNPGCASCN